MNSDLILGIRLKGFDKAAKSKILSCLSGSGVDFCKQRYKFGCCTFFLFQNLKCLKIKNNYKDTSLH